MLQARQDRRVDTRVPSTKQTLKRCCAGIRTIIGYSFIVIASRWRKEINNDFSILPMEPTGGGRHAVLTVSGAEIAGEKFLSHHSKGGFDRAREKCVATTLLRRSPPPSLPGITPTYFFYLFGPRSSPPGKFWHLL